MLADNVCTAGSYTLSIGALSAASSLAHVTSVSPAIDLVDGAVYTVSVAYQDRGGNAEASASVATITFAGSSTIAPVFSTPATSSFISTNFTVDFTLQEIALANSVQMIITPTGGTNDGNGARTITFAPAHEAASRHTFNMQYVSIDV